MGVWDHQKPWGTWKNDKNKNLEFKLEFKLEVPPTRPILPMYLYTHTVRLSACFKLRSQHASTILAKTSSFGDTLGARDAGPQAQHTCYGINQINDGIFS